MSTASSWKVIGNCEQWGGVGWGGFLNSNILGQRMKLSWGFQRVGRGSNQKTHVKAVIDTFMLKGGSLKNILREGLKNYLSILSKESIPIPTLHK